MARTGRAAAVGVGTRLAIPALATLVVATSPAAAGPADTVTEELIRTLNANLLYAAVPVTVLVEGVLIYTVWEFRESRQDEAKPTQENRLLEITWTVATAVILVFVGVASYQVLAHPMVAQTETAQLEMEGDPVVVDVTAQRYFWAFEYNGTGVETQNELVLPTDRPIVLNVTSRDWLHAFHVPELGLKQDAFPGHAERILTRANEEGMYQGYCAEYCGVGHSQMMFTVEVTNQSEYQEWLAGQQDGGAGNATADGGGAGNATADDGAGNATADATARDDSTAATATGDNDETAATAPDSAARSVVGARAGTG